MYRIYFSLLLTLLLNDADASSPAVTDATKAPTRSLVFFDHKEPLDSMSFLYNRYPHLVEACNALLPAEEYDEAEMDRELHAEGDPKGAYLETLEEFLGLSVYDPLAFNNDSEAAVKEYRLELSELKLYAPDLHKLSYVDLLLYGRQSDPCRTIAEDMVIASRRIHNIVLKHGQAPVLFLGRSPAFLQVAYEELCLLDNPNYDRSHILHLSFSGAPDAITLRTATYFASQEANIIRDVVTPEKLEFYQRYMTQMGMDKVGDKLYLVDMIGTGTSLNSFLRLARHYYQSHLSRTMPDIHFISISTSLGSNHSFGPWQYSQNTGKLICKSDSERGLRAFSIKLSPLQLSYSTINRLLDNDYFQALATHGIEFPAQKWRNEYLEELKTGGRWHQDAYLVLRRFFSNLQAQYEAKLTQIGNSLIHDVE